MTSHEGQLTDLNESHLKDVRMVEKEKENEVQSLIISLKVELEKEIKTLTTSHDAQIHDMEEYQSSSNGND